MIIDPEFISSVILISTGFIGAFIAAIWVAFVIWTYRDIRSRARDKFVHLLATILVAVLTLPGILVYLVLRPPRTLEEEYQSTLEEEALLRAIEDQIICPGCGRHLHQEWVVCPTCQTKVQQPCMSCGKLMELSWNICPFCSTPASGLRKDIAKDEKMEEMTTSEISEKDIEE